MEPLVASDTVIVAYLLGSVPFAYLLGRLARGVDIRQVGTGNAGALNTFRQIRPAAGVAVMLLDAVKGMVAVSLPSMVGAPRLAEYASAVAVLVGHNWSLCLGFHGGKGAATVAGASLTVLPWLILIAIGPTLLVVAAPRNAVAGIVAGFVVLNSLIIATGQGWDQVALYMGMSLVVGATYLVDSWGATVQAARRGRWTELLSFE